jgi:hypothetical protein
MRQIRVASTYSLAEYIVTACRLNNRINRNDPDRAAAKRAMEAMMTMKKIDIATIEAARRGEGR